MFHYLEANKEEWFTPMKVYSNMHSNRIVCTKPRVISNKSKYVNSSKINKEFEKYKEEMASRSSPEPMKRPSIHHAFDGNCLI